MDFLEIIKSFTDKDLSAFNDFKFKIGADISALMALLTIAGLFLFIYLSFRSVRDLKSKSKRALLITFRAGALFFILFILFEPKLELRETKKIKSSLAVLFDDSLSMGLKLEEPKLSRSESLKNYISKNKSYFNKLESDFNVDYYTFGGGIKGTTLDGFLGEGRADQPATKIGEAIEKLKSINPKAEYKDVLLFSDGSDNGKLDSLFSSMNTDLDKELLDKYLRSLGVNIHAVACEGEDEEFYDLAVEKVVADKFGFIRTPFEMELHISANGIEPKSIPITLKEGDNIVKTANLVIRKGVTDYKVKMKFYPQKIGRRVYTIALPTYAKELIQVNNERSFFVNIIRDKTRVLFVVGNPSWDERFLRRTLKTNPNFDLISFMILRTSYDYLNVPEKEMSLIPFPTQEIFDRELHTFDVVVFCNFDSGPYVNRLYLNNIKNFVIRDGGGFVMVGGDRSFTSGRYANTPIGDILPVEITRLTRNVVPFKFGVFKPVLTDVGNVHPILRMDYDEAKNKEIYDSLPALEGINSVLKLKDDASALMLHPKAKNEHGAAPVIAISEMGKGRTMAITTDTLWHWNFPYVGEGGSTRIYDNFWHNAIKWLIKDPELDLVKLSLPDTSFPAGEPIRIRLKVLSHKYQPTDKANIRAEVKGPDKKIVKLFFKQGETPGEYSSEFVPESDGNYVIEAAAYLDEKYLGKDIYPFIVEDNKAEYLNLEVNHDLLEKLSEVSESAKVIVKNGKMEGTLNLKPERNEQLLGKIELTFWDSKMNFIIIMLFLISEWYIRRKYGLY